MREPVPGLRLGHAVADFLADLAHANRAAATIRAYRTDLASFPAYHRGPPESITPDVLRGYFATLAHLAPATRARHEATLASLLRWAYRQELITANPMDKLDRVRLPAPAPRGLPAGQVAAILAVIPRHRLRDRVLFGLIAETGLRAGEALGVYLEDLDMTPGDEHLRVLGKGGRTRTVLLDDDRLVATLRRYLTATGYRSGPLFRAEKNHVGGPLRYASAQTRWAQYCHTAGVAATLHQLRHTHATAMVDGGVSLATIRKRLGHANLQTVLRYAEQSDQVADTELRAWRRRDRSLPRIPRRVVVICETASDCPPRRPAALAPDRSRPSWSHCRGPGRQGGGLGPRRRGRRRSGVPGEVAAVMRDGRPVRGVATDHEGGVAGGRCDTSPGGRGPACRETANRVGRIQHRDYGWPGHPP